jgi:hypothetical protein
MFTTPLDLRAHRPNEWVLLNPLVWEGPPFRIVVPARFITDLASVPKIMRGLLNVNGPSRRAGVLHDWLYCLQPCTRAEADAVLKAALRAEGMGWAANLYYAGVRVGGWRYWGRRAHGTMAEDFSRR